MRRLTFTDYLVLVSKTKAHYQEYVPAKKIGYRIPSNKPYIFLSRISSSIPTALTSALVSSRRAINVRHDWPGSALFQEEKNRQRNGAVVVVYNVSLSQRLDRPVTMLLSDDHEHSPLALPGCFFGTPDVQTAPRPSFTSSTFKLDFPMTTLVSSTVGSHAPSLPLSSDSGERDEPHYIMCI